MLQQWLKSRQKLLKDTQDFSTRSWFRWCAGRITASVMHAVFATSLETPAQSVVNCVSYPANCVCYTNKMGSGAWRGRMKGLHPKNFSTSLQTAGSFMQFYCEHNFSRTWSNSQCVTVVGRGAWRLSVLLNTQRTALSRHWMHRIKTSAWSQLQMDFTERGRTPTTHRCKHKSLSPAPTTVTSLHGLKETWLWYASSLM